MKVFGVTGWSGSGKTTLVERLVSHLTATGVSVSTVKHAHHGFDIDRPGKDSYRHRAAGAAEVLTVSDERWFLQHELRDPEPPALAALLRRLAPVDLVLIEGFKSDPLPKLEMIHPGRDSWRFPDDRTILAVALVGVPCPTGCGLPAFDADDIAGLAGFVMERAVDLDDLA